MNYKRLYITAVILLAVLSATVLLLISGKNLFLNARHASNGFSDIATDIETTGTTFGYASDSCRDLVAIVRQWDMPLWKNRIAQAKQDSDAKTTSINQLAVIEEEAAHFLYDRIRKAIHNTDNSRCFDLAPIVQYQEATCVGYSSLYYILGKSLGLSIQVVEVRRDYRGRDVRHAVCIVHLSDGTEIMADLVDGGFFSKRFHFQDEFSEEDGFYELKQKNNPLHLHGRIKPWSNAEFVSLIYSHRVHYEMNDGKYADALRDVNKAIALNPMNDDAFLSRAQLKKMCHKYPAAISDATKAIEINPRSDLAYEARGSAYSRAGDDKKAASDFSRSIEINPRNALAYVGRGYSMSRLGKAKEAERDYQKAVELDPSLEELVELSSLLSKRPATKHEMRNTKDE